MAEWAFHTFVFNINILHLSFIYRHNTWSLSLKCYSRCMLVSCSKTKIKYLLILSLFHSLRHLKINNKPAAGEPVSGYCKIKHRKTTFDVKRDSNPPNSAFTLSTFFPILHYFFTFIISQISIRQNFQKLVRKHIF